MSLINFDHGVIASLEIPDDWQNDVALQTEALEIGGRSIRRVFSAANDEVRICSYLRTIPISAAASQTFQSTLYSDLHELTSEEFLALEEIIEAMSYEEAFERQLASTGHFEGRRSLRIDGVWTELQHQTDALFFAADEKASTVQQLYFIAPVDLFALERPKAEQILRSVKWR